MYKDIINYELAEGVTKEQLFTIAKQIARHWMKNLPGFLKWEIHSNSEGSYTDIVYWKSKEDAKLAEKDMANIPNANDWYVCYKQGSITSRNLTTLAEF